MRTILLLAVDCLGGTINLHADPLHFETGRLRLEGKQLFVQFGQEQPILLSDFETSLEIESRADEKNQILNVVTLMDETETNGTIIPKVRRHDAKIRLSSSHLPEIAQVLITRVHLPEDREAHIWVANETTFVDKNFPVFYFKVDGRKRILENRLSASGELPYFQDGHFHADESLALTSEKEHTIIFYDRFSGRLLFADFFGPQTFPLTIGTNVLVSPDSFKSGQPFHAGGQIEFDEATRELRLIPHHGSPAILVPSRTFHVPKKDLAEVREAKASNRAQWKTNTSETLTLLENAAVPADSVVLAPNVKIQIDRLLQNRNDQASGLPQVTLLPITIPHSILKTAPYVADLFAKKITQLIADDFERRGSGDFFYLKTPSRFAPPSVTKAIETYGLTKRRLDRKAAMVILDLTKSFPPPESTKPIYEFIQFLAPNIATPSRRTNLIVLMSQHHPAPSEISLPSTQSIRREEAIKAEASLSVDFRTEELFRVIRQHTVSDLTLAQLQAILQSIAEQSDFDPLAELDITESKLSSVLEYAREKVDLDTPEGVLTVANMFKKLLGSRSPDVFDESIIARLERLPSLLSNKSPTRGPRAFHDREDILDGLVDIISTWMVQESQNDHPSLFLEFMGDNGTGKTELVKELTRALGAELEVINCTLHSKSRSGGEQAGAWPTEHLMRLTEEIGARIEKLTLNPNPLKILFLDEKHAVPEVIRSMLSGAGNADSRQNRILNFDGIIVISASNVPVGGESYNELLKLKFGDHDYPRHIGNLFSLTYSPDPNKSYDKEKNAAFEKVVSAYRGRLLSRMFFFRPLQQNPAQQESLVVERVANIAKANGARFILQQSAKNSLTKLAASYSAGNYRTVEDIIDHKIASAITRLRRRNSTRDISGGTYLLRYDESAKNLTLIDVRTDTEGMKFIVEETYQTFHREVLTELDRRIAQIAEAEAEGVSMELAELRETYQGISDGIQHSHTRPLFESVDGVPQVATLSWPALPGVINADERRRFENYIEEQTNNFYGGDDTVQFIDGVIVAYNRLENEINQRKGFRNGSTRHEHWADSIAQSHLERKHQDEKVKVAGIEISFMEDAIAKWRSLQTSLEQATERTRINAFIGYGGGMISQLKELALETTRTNFLMDFLSLLTAPKPGEEGRAGEILSEHKANREKRQLATVDPNTIPDRGKLRLAIAYGIDLGSRKAAEVYISGLRKDAAEFSIRNERELNPPTQNGCALERFAIGNGRIKHAVDAIFARQN